MANQNNSNVNDLSISSNEKPWDRPWSTDQMRQNAHDWNLAGDSGLLKHLQEFSQTVLTRTHATEKALDSLIEDINTSCTEINNINNRFVCLANTQFVENRVYEDDEKETPQDVPLLNQKSKEETEALMLKKVREALSMSVAVLDTMFEPIEIHTSDSEGEFENDQSGAKTLLLEPHNPYVHRPLPYLIGSDAFMSDDKIGLGDSPSDGEERLFDADVDQDVELSSESETEIMQPDRKRDYGAYSSHSSASGSFVDSGMSTQIVKKVKYATSKEGSSFHPSAEHQHISSELESGNSFAAQLASKLGSLTSAAASDSMVVNRTPSDKPQKDDLFGGPISDEEDDTLFGSSSGLFSGRPKRFDDLDDTSNAFWGKTSAVENKESATMPTVSNPEAKSQSLVLADDDLFGRKLSDNDDDGVFSFKGNERGSSEIKASNLFSEGDGTRRQWPEEGTSSPAASVRHDRTAINKNVGHAEDRKPIQESGKSSIEEKKPAGGVLMFGQTGILEGLKDILPPRLPSSSSESENAEVKGSGSSLSGVCIATHDSQGVSAGSQSKSFIPPLASSSSRNSFLPANLGYQSRDQLPSVSNVSEDSLIKSTSSVPGELLAEIDDNAEEDLFAVPSAFKPSAYLPPQTSSNIFSGNDDFDDLFSDPKEVNFTSSQTSTSQRIFKDDFRTTADSTMLGSPTVADVNDDAKNKSLPTSKAGFSKTYGSNVFNSDMFSSVPPPLRPDSKVKTMSLFDESDSGEDDILFSSASSAGSRRSQASADLLSVSSVSNTEKKPLSKKGLFDDDDALFGSLDNDPGVDIFSSPAQPSSPKQSEPLDGNHISKKSSQPLPTASEQNKEPPLKENGVTPAHVDVTTISSTAPIRSDRGLFADADDLYSDIFATTSTIKEQSHMNKDDSSVMNAEGSNVLVHSPPDLLTDKIDVYGSTSTQIITKINSKEESNVVKNSGITGSVGAISKPPVKTKPKKPEPPKTLNIRKETDPGLLLVDDYDDDDDIFSSSIKKLVESEVLETAKKPPVDNTTPNESSIQSRREVGDAKSEAKPPAFNEQKVFNGNMETSEVDAASIDVKNVKHLLSGGTVPNLLRIDPLALLPGAKPPSKRTPPNESSPGKLSDGTKTAGSTALDQSSLSLGSEHAIGFDQPILESATLPSVHKDRAKLGVRRRPPSTKARREAARASQSYHEGDHLESPGAILSPSTDEDDMFGVPQDSSPECGKQRAPSADIFGGAPILSPVATVAEDSEQVTQLSAAFSGSLSPPRARLITDAPKLESSPFLPLSCESAVINTESPGDFSVSSESGTGIVSSAQEPKLSDFGSQEMDQSRLKISKARDVEIVPGFGAEHGLPFTPSKNWNALSEAVVVDPLNDSDPLISCEDKQLIAEGKSDDSDDHSSLFAFVKKNMRDVPSKPLFSRAPSLPSKAEGSVTNSKGGTVDDSDLFSSSVTSAASKIVDAPNTQKSGDGKIWRLSDDDDDDLFQSGGKSSSKPNSEHTAYAVNVSSTALLKDKPNKEVRSVAPIPVVKSGQTTSGNGIFGSKDDSGDEDGLFSKSPVFSKSKLKSGVPLSTSLFDEDDDDLFGPSKSVIKRPQDPKPAEAPRVVSSSSITTKKLKPGTPFEDPLMAAQKIDD